MKDELKANMTSAESWKRGFFMLLFLLFYSLAEMVVLAIALFQFGSSLITGSINEQLKRFGASLSVYIYQIMGYLTYNTEEKVYPFGDWPKVDEEEESDQ